jgi:hypothetical protein
MIDKRGAVRFEWDERHFSASNTPGEPDQRKVKTVKVALH